MLEIWLLSSPLVVQCPARDTAASQLMRKVRKVQFYINFDRPQLTLPGPELQLGGRELDQSIYVSC